MMLVSIEGVTVHVNDDKAPAMLASGRYTEAATPATPKSRRRTNKDNANAEEKS